MSVLPGLENEMAQALMTPVNPTTTARSIYSCAGDDLVPVAASGLTGLL